MPFLIILILLMVVAGSALLFHRMEEGRKDAMGRVADGLGFSFHRDGDASLQQGLSSLPLFQRGRRRRLSSLMMGKIEGLSVAAFDYVYVTGSGKHSRTWSQTVVRIELAEGRLPAFGLRPENLLDRVGEWFGGKDIDFASRPEFSKRYWLRGENEGAVRTLFRDEVLAFFEDHTGFSVESASGQLAVYRPARRIKPEECREFIQQCLEVVRVLAPWAAAGDAVMPPPRSRLQ